MEKSLPDATLGRKPVPDGLIWAPKETFSRELSGVPARDFEDERVLALGADAPHGPIALDTSLELGCPYPATTPLMLARYLVLHEQIPLDMEVVSTGAVYYVLFGSGRTTCGDYVVDWTEGDSFCLPAEGVIGHVASSPALLFQVTNEPELAFSGFTSPPPGRSKVAPAIYRRAAIDAKLAEVHRAFDGVAVGEYVNITSPAQEAMRTALPTMVIGFNSLQPGGEQRPHHHNAAAITLSIAGDGVYSMIDGKRFDWRPGGVLLTPPNAVHSHHNNGPRPMKSFVAQDGGLFHYCRATGFAHVSR